MDDKPVEVLLYGGESPQDVFAFQEYRKLIERGKTLLQLKAMAEQVTPEIRSHWAARTFGAVETSDGTFDEVVCNLAYHYWKHGQKKYQGIAEMTEAALLMFQSRRAEAVLRHKDGLLQFPDNSLFQQDGKIVTFVS